MTNDELLTRLKEIGKLPGNADDDFPLKEFDDILQEFTLPIDFKTAVALVNLSPPVNESCCEIEWSLVHLVENYPTDDFQRVLDAAEDGEVKRLLQIRLDNYNRKNKVD
jgi:hypothetical protein